MKLSIAFFLFVLAVLAGPAYAAEDKASADDGDAQAAGQAADRKADRDKDKARPKNLVHIPGTMKFRKIPYKAPKPIRFSYENRFGRPADPVIGRRNAQNVVLNEVSYDDLPAPVRADIEGSVRNCPVNGKLGEVKAYSYVSDLIRGRGLSPNYLVDLSALGPNPESCGAGLGCNDSGCLLVAYHSYGYEQWKRDLVLRNESWKLSTARKSKGKDIPNLSKPAPLTYLNVNAYCSTGQGRPKPCRNHYLWQVGGLSEYSPPPSGR